MVSPQIATSVSTSSPVIRSKTRPPFSTRSAGTNPGPDQFCRQAALSAWRSPFRSGNLKPMRRPVDTANSGTLPCAPCAASPSNSPRSWSSSSWQALIKATAAHVPAGQAVFFRSFFAIPVIVVWLLAARTADRPENREAPLGHIWRGVVGTCAMGLGFAGLGYLPLPEVTAIGYAAPLLTVIFAAMFLGEEVRLFRISAVALGMTGVLIVLAPRLSIGPDSASVAEAFGAMLVLGRRGLRGAGAGLRPQAGEHRGDLGHRVLLLADRDPPVAGHPALRLGLAHGEKRRCWSARGFWAGSARSS
jgi:uncharacterized membrane protein